MLVTTDSEVEFSNSIHEIIKINFRILLFIILTVRKRLLDSVMVPRSYQGPLKLDLRAAATEWLRRPTKNFGVELEVEDSLQNKMDPTQLFEVHECSSRKNTLFFVHYLCSLFKISFKGPSVILHITVLSMQLLVRDNPNPNVCTDNILTSSCNVI